MTIPPFESDVVPHPVAKQETNTNIFEAITMPKVA
jgi:hypothetical protein